MRRLYQLRLLNFRRFFRPTRHRLAQAAARHQSQEIDSRLQQVHLLLGHVCQLHLKRLQLVAQLVRFKAKGWSSQGFLHRPFKFKVV